MEVQDLANYVVRTNNLDKRLKLLLALELLKDECPQVVPNIQKEIDNCMFALTVPRKP